jgi:hypothetical protein
MVLVYNQTRSIQGEFELTDELNDLFNKHGEKFYAKGKYNPRDGKVYLNDIVATQPW